METTEHDGTLDRHIDDEENINARDVMELRDTLQEVNEQQAVNDLEIDLEIAKEQEQLEKEKE